MREFDKNDTTLYASLSGRILKIEETAEPLFSQRIIGDGFAIEPSDGKIFAPVSGTITLVQRHAIGITRIDGLEVLLHIGIDTVLLSESPYKFSVELGDNVVGGEEIGKVDLSAISAAGLKKTTMVVFTNTADKLSDFTVEYTDAAAGAAIGVANVRS